MVDDYVVVYTAHGKLDAEMIKLLLESNGVGVVTAGESVGSSYGFTFGPLGDVDILVPKSSADAAQAILDAMERGDLDIDTPPQKKTEK